MEKALGEVGKIYPGASAGTRSSYMPESVGGIQKARMDSVAISLQSNKNGKPVVNNLITVCTDCNGQ
ncbi:MAG: hypothetical protein AAGU75_21670 [Bacillota bacterium]